MIETLTRWAVILGVLATFWLAYTHWNTVPTVQVPSVSGGITMIFK
jgi:hypothetical protein